MPRVSLGNNKTSTKSGNGPLCPDNSSNVYDISGTGVGQGKPQLHHSRIRREERTNGLLPVSRRDNNTAHASPTPIKPTGKPLALHAALHGHSSNGKDKPDQERPRLLKSNGVMEKPIVQRDTSCQTQSEQTTCSEDSGKGKSGSFHKSAIEHFSVSFKEATVSLVRTTEDFWSAEKNARKVVSSTNCAKPATERLPGGTRAYQDSDGYCPDLELSDSEPEAKGKRLRTGKGMTEKSPAVLFGRGGSRGKVSLGSRPAVQR